MKPWRTVQAVLSAFFGIRGSGAARRDRQQLSPLAIIVTALALALLLVLTLVGLVRWVAGAGG